MLDPAFLLFVPGDRPERFTKALDAPGVTGAILDLEDAVAPDRKAHAREQVTAFLNAHADLGRVVVRMNPPSEPLGIADLAALSGARRPAAIMVPKVHDAGDVARVADALGDTPQIVLIESARALVHCEQIAAAPHVFALAFGPYDLAAELGAASEADALLPHRARMLVAARAAGRYALDGPAREYGDASIPKRDAEHAVRLGFDGKLLIHPAQLAPVRAAFAPTAEQVAYARRIVDASLAGSPAVLDGTMIDAPVVALAERVLRRAG